MKPRDQRTNVVGLKQVQRVAIDVDTVAERVRKLEQRNTFGSPVMASLPTNPINGQTIFFQTAAMLSAGIVWEFRYNDSGGVYKWEFVGGGAWNSIITTAETTTSTTYANLATVGPDITIPLAGVYSVTFGAAIDYSVITTNRVARCAISNAGSTPSDTNSIRSAHYNVTGMVQTHSMIVEETVANAGDTLRVQYRTPADTARFASRFISVIPERVG